MPAEGKNPEPGDQTPVAADQLGEEHLMPWERASGPTGGGSAAEITEGLDALFAKDPEFPEFHDDEEEGEPPTADDDEPESVGSDEDEDEIDESDEEEVDESELEDESEDEEEAEEDEAVEEVVELDDSMLVPVKVGGEEEHVPLREALDGYQRQADYTRKTQELSEERKALQETVSETRAVREALGQQLAVLEQALSEEGTPPNWDELREQDPQRFANEWAAYQLRQQKLQQVRQLQEANATQARTEAEKALEARLVEERNKLSEVLPQWKDEAKLEAGMAEIHKYISDTYGATDDELKEIYDHRFVLMARKAMLYDRATSKATGDGGPKVRARKGGRVLAPGAKPTGSRKSTKKGKKNASKKVKAFKRARERLRRSGRSEDAAAALLALEDE